MHQLENHLVHLLVEQMVLDLVVYLVNLLACCLELVMDYYLDIVKEYQMAPKLEHLLVIE